MNDKLLYLQMQKTGCTHITCLLSNCVGGTEYGKHSTLKDGRKPAKFVFSSVRNPWHWYVSLWAFGCDGKGNLYTRVTKRQPIERLIISAVRRPISFLRYLRIPGELWRETYGGHDDSDKFKKWLKFMFDERRKGDFGEGYARSPISSFAGLMTYRYCRLCLKDFLQMSRKVALTSIDALKEYDEENNVLDATVRTEHLESDLIQILKGAGYSVGPGMVNFLYMAKERRKNTSRHLDPKLYYDEETIDLVAQKESFLIEKYGYEGP